jgi:hypothetical protein
MFEKKEVHVDWSSIQGVGNVRHKWKEVNLGAQQGKFWGLAVEETPSKGPGVTKAKAERGLQRWKQSRRNEVTHK